MPTSKASKFSFKIIVDIFFCYWIYCVSPQTQENIMIVTYKTQCNVILIEAYVKNFLNR